MPGTAAGTVRRKQRTVASATCCGLACVACFLPGMTMLGLSRIASSGTRWRASSANTERSVRSVTAKQVSIEWPPSIRTSGSTIGTRSCSMAMAA